jgi:hypothetical protein
MAELAVDWRGRTWRVWKPALWFNPLGKGGGETEFRKGDSVTSPHDGVRLMDEGVVDVIF